jgi:cell division protein FtsN
VPVVVAPPKPPRPAPVPAEANPLPPSNDPLGDLARARAGGNNGSTTTASAAPSSNNSAATGADPFMYFVQAGAFRTTEDAEAQRAKLSLMGVEARVTEREQAGRTVYRVRAGPFNKKDDADRLKERLDSGGLESALVRVQR